MGRAERRWAERRNRIESRKGKLLIDPTELTEIKKKASHETSRYDTEALMTCFALAEHRLFGFGAKRIMRSLQYINDLMNDILTEKAVMEDYIKELEKETGILIVDEE